MSAHSVQLRPDSCDSCLRGFLPLRLSPCLDSVSSFVLSSSLSCFRRRLAAVPRAAAAAGSRRGAAADGYRPGEARDLEDRVAAGAFVAGDRRQQDFSDGGARQGAAGDDLPRPGERQDPVARRSAAQDAGKNPRHRQLCPAEPRGGCRAGRRDVRLQRPVLL